MRNVHNKPSCFSLAIARRQPPIFFCQFATFHYKHIFVHMYLLLHKHFIHFRFRFLIRYNFRSIEYSFSSVFVFIKYL